MKTTSIKTIYLKEYELKQAIVEYLAREHEDLAQHLYDNECDMAWGQDGKEFLVSIDGEVEDKEVLPENAVFPVAGNTDYSHIRSHCVAWQEGGVGCPDCYDFICDVCGKKHNSMERQTLKTEQLSGVVMCEECSGGNTTERVEEQSARLEKIAEQKKINEVFDQIEHATIKAAKRVMEEHSETLQKLAESEE
ncbi:MAG: hypothetical protein H8E74_02670 [Gammaproteobacteria bacterium]|nr:hypothetical protein [Gammaproteobacteria bacterium]|tara:strand:+ start:2156 stop:2734 length:579 start_codon:yes stop_codon:yes gene_type:complete